MSHTGFFLLLSLVSDGYWVILMKTWQWKILLDQHIDDQHPLSQSSLAFPEACWGSRAQSRGRLVRTTAQRVLTGDWNSVESFQAPKLSPGRGDKAVPMEEVQGGVCWECLGVQIKLELATLDQICKSPEKILAH